MRRPGDDNDREKWEQWIQTNEKSFLEPPRILREVWSKSKYAQYEVKIKIKAMYINVMSKTTMVYFPHDQMDFHISVLHAK